MLSVPHSYLEVCVCVTHQAFLTFSVCDTRLLRSMPRGRQSFSQRVATMRKKLENNKTTEDHYLAFVRTLVEGKIRSEAIDEYPTWRRWLENSNPLTSPIPFTVSTSAPPPRRVAPASTEGQDLQSDGESLQLSDPSYFEEEDEEPEIDDGWVSGGISFF